MISSWDASSVITAIDVAEAIALVMTGGSTSQLAQYWYQAGYQISQLQLWGRSGTCPAAFYARSKDSAVFAVAGMDSAKQAAALVGSLSVPMVKAGPWQANSVAVADAIYLQRLLRSTNLSNVSNLLVSGYSYGGCLASILAALQLGEISTPSMQLMTFGSPRPGASSLASYLRQLMSVRYFNDNDAVTHFPPHIDEAPALYAVLPYSVALIAMQHVHIAGGVQLNANGDATNAEVSSLFTVTAEIDLAAWVQSVLAGQSSAHSLLTYADRLSKLQSKLSASGKALPTGAGDEYSAALIASQSVSGPLASSAVVKLALAGKAKTMAYFPIPLRPKVTKVLDAYYVYWMGHLIATCETQSSAKTIAKYLFKFLHVWQRAGAVPVSTTIAAFNDFLSVAGSSTQGPVPPFHVLFP